MRDMEIYANYSQKTKYRVSCGIKNYMKNNLEILVLRIVAPTRKEANELCERIFATMQTKYMQMSLTR